MRAWCSTPGSLPNTRDRAAVGPDDVEDHAHRRRLAGAVRPEEAEHLAGADVERQVAHDVGRAEALPDPVDRRPTARRPRPVVACSSSRVQASRIARPHGRKRTAYRCDAMRIVSLLPSATEIVFALGLGDELVGRTHECDYPAEVGDVPVMTADVGRGCRTRSSREINDRVAAVDPRRQLDLPRSTSTRSRRPTRPDPHPGAVHGLRGELPRGRRGGPPSRRRRDGRQPRADVDRGHPQHHLDRRRDGRGGGRGGRPDRDAARAAGARSRTASSSAGWTGVAAATRRLPRMARPAVRRRATGCPSRSAAPAAGTCWAAIGEPARRDDLGSTCATSIPSS